MHSRAKTVPQYLAELPKDRREAMSAVRDVILENLPKGYEEGMAYGMIGYHVPHSVYPPGYHCNPEQPLPFACLVSQKNHMALYLMSIYGFPALDAWFRKAWTGAGKRLDMGKSCVRFNRLDDVPLKVIGQVIKKVPVKKFIEHYEATIRPPDAARKKAAARKKSASRK
jgi:hypothetical protein